MNRAFVWFCFMLVYYLMLINGCSLMKKTTKANSNELQTASVKAQLNHLDLSKTIKETNLYLYRTDGSLYGYQNSKEQVDQTGFGSANLESATSVKKELTIKERTPVKIWTWLSAFGICMVSLVAYKRYSSK